MYILTGDKKQIINSDFVERFCISEKPDAALIVASYDKNAKVAMCSSPFRLSRWSGI